MPVTPASHPLLSLQSTASTHTSSRFPLKHEDLHSPSLIRNHQLILQIISVSILPPQFLSHSPSGRQCHACTHPDDGKAGKLSLRVIPLFSEDRSSIAGHHDISPGRSNTTSAVPFAPAYVIEIQPLKRKRRFGEQRFWCLATAMHIHLLNPSGVVVSTGPNFITPRCRSLPQSSRRGLPFWFQRIALWR